MECFVVYRYDIEGRIDPLYYLSLKNSDYLKLKNSVFPVVHLRDISEFITKGESPLWRGYKFKDSGIPFLRGKNIKDGKIDFTDVVYISEKVHRRMKRSQLNDKFFLLTMAGTLGEAAIFKKDYPESNINQDIAKIKLKEELVLPEYLVVFFQTSLAKSQINLLSNGGTRNHLNFEQIKSFIIPLPPLEIQARIVQIMDNAYKIKKQKEAEAKQFLDSINDYVLSELGIEMPELKDQMTFVVYADDVKGGRVDPHYYQPKFKDVMKAVENGKYTLVKIGDTLKVATKLEGLKNYDEIQYVDLASIEKNLGIIKDYKIMKASEAPSRARQKVEKGDLLVASLSGSLKSIAIVDKDENNIIASTGFHVIKKSENYNNWYHWALFRTNIYQILLNRETTGAIMSAINMYSFLNLKIPIPPLEIQNKIAEEVKRRMQKAEQLQKEAKEILEKAKQEVENIILNGA